MDYVVGSVAALISGNVTPNRPKLIRRALTPTKHQPSPNVTPKSEFVDDRSIFLSPSVQKKKAIVKKSPKRIFQNPDLDVTENEESTSPKADKVKKHLKEDLGSDETGMAGPVSKKSPNKKADKSLNSSKTSTKAELDVSQASNKGTPKKKKKRNSESNVSEESKEIDATTHQNNESKKSPKKKMQRRKSTVDFNDENESENTIENNEENVEKSNETNENTHNTVKKNKKRKKKNKKHQPTENIEEKANNENSAEATIPLKKLKKNKNKESKTDAKNIEKEESSEMDLEDQSDEEDKSNNIANPNAITEKETDSEHESDNDIESEDEEINKTLLETEQADNSSDEEEEEEKKEQKKRPEKEKKGAPVEKERDLEDEIKRTIFVGNVPLSKKTRKEIKKIFREYGEIQTVRIRFVPVKDARVTPKLAVIKNELHPERTTVNVYVKFADASSVEKALAANNTVLNGHHLRVSRSGSSGAEHDPRCAVFVGNLPFGVEDDQLRAAFDKCGEIESVRIIRDKKTNAGKGFGYVNFTSKDGVELALNLTEEELTIKNRILRVKRCTHTLGAGGQKHGGQGPRGQPRGQRPGQGNGGQRFGGQGSGSQGPRGARPGGQGDGVQKFGGQKFGGQRFGGQGSGSQGTRGPRPGGQGDGGQKFGGPKFGGQRPGGPRFGGQGPRGQGSGPPETRDGAQRRLMHKRKFQESNGDAPPNKRQNLNQPHKEKKSRKEFVGMTAEKKKKPKFNKGQKKKQALSEILTKKRS